MKKIFVFISAMLVLFLTTTAYAADRYWDANGATSGCGGAGNWETSSSLWSDASCSGTYGVWPNTTSDSATFTSSGSAYTITVTANVNVNKITNNAAQTLAVVGASTITFGGTSPWVHSDKSINFGPALKGAV